MHEILMFMATYSLIALLETIVVWIVVKRAQNSFRIRRE